jgi:uridylate kinase
MSTAVIKIGGSIFYQKDLNINVDFLKKVVDWYESQKTYENVVFVVGGGSLSRFLLNQVKGSIISDCPKHQIGIKVTHVNAMVFLSFFNSKELRYFESISELCSNVKEGTKGAVIGGIVEGWSTDMVAANVANELGVKTVYKISNIDYIYSVDPNQQENAKSFEKLTWEEYIKIFNTHIGNKHKPGMSAPIDIECSLFCREEKISFRVSGGNLERDLTELLNSGTLVSG